MTTTELGTFLKARRGHVQPGDVGLTVQGGRRVSGLRREEVAMLAGVSIDYYTRLEQGRERNPSGSVLNAVSGALVLDDDLRAHVFRLADLAPAPRSAVRGTVDASLQDLLSAWSHTPAFIVDRQLDILARNELATALYSGFARADNIARMTFLDPSGRDFFSDWTRATETCVANLRLALGHADGQDRVQALVAEIHAASAEFRLVWNRHDVRGKTHEAKAFRHPEVGDLLLEYTAFDVRSSPGQQLIVYHALPGTASADNLLLLGSLAATRGSGVVEPGASR
ncbi:helix-turn-helix domain-containing protein [Curtobacterium sp. VKM Ac-2887]|uniref:helix-turn-helix domain-containing protein n=1 Tax=Curtobacterium sp. VKM Ac-2887 TaxID=2783819 RepID=UPI00188CD6FF|nr:helix-turn-helix transcriptional regulator [Curtobacterium sp. VKM Ac-2887]MBF4588229.1 helix-turn-helix domain-containing protein [Curtobacterium sp. VKM Ac-2887]